MKKFLSIVLISLFCSIPVFAQTAAPEPENWTNFAPEDEEFSLDAPARLFLKDFSTVAKDDDGRRYRNTLNGTYYYVFSDEAKKPLQYDMVADFARTSRQLGEIAKFGEIEAQKFAFTDKTEFHHTILLIKGKTRTYAFQTVSPTPENPAVERFFNSLKFGGQPADKKIVGPKNEKDVTVSIPLIQTEVRPAERPAGLGQGPGDTVKPMPTPAVKNSLPVRIVSKPRANYTDLARFYELEGKVTLRVTFLASGTIGSITALARLPFGLTEEALKAAQGLTFEPALRNSQPVNITKPVEYIFTIF